ncbi:family 20 glycosylhydrolase [Pedobacter arcticus]|uniref:family 20 glycosylhydrolase n=1 Tax=Pedobacter arcticus TaxID=752140 RepID=UPI0018722F44|nr:family 20 glycosylhydrolase [Pedobacter arcticus]
MMKLFRCFYFLVFILFCSISGFAQLALPSFSQTAFSTYYWQKLSHFETLPKKEHQTLFIGDSITDGGEWATIFGDTDILNMGISGDISAGVINRLPSLINRQPKKVFLLIGINDLARNVSVDSLFKNISLITNYIKQESPSTQIFVQSILPVNNSFKTFATHTNKTASILQVNTLLQSESKKLNYTFLDFYNDFCDKQGKLNANFTNDGLHLKGAGYALWKHLLYPYVYDLNKQASIIPQPKSVVLGKELFPLYKVKYIVYDTDSLKTEAVLLQEILYKLGLRVGITKKKTDDCFIQLSQQKEPLSLSPNSESYHLKVDTNKILLQAQAKAGFFYGIQTLKQLSRDGYFINTVEINDTPAFTWRGYMVDVGRNYQSVKLLKQQIDIMASYKLNVFHMHLTEDIAWRLAVKAYPELTMPEYMERNKGMYYSEAEIKDLINYCKDRHILFLPEIDMPGHSAAFKRAMKTDMQSDAGLAIVKNILKEFFETYELSYIHIGADEVKITNRNFLPEISAFLKSLNKTIIGWEPGGNFDESTIRQLWMDDAGLTAGKTKIQYIDSRHLYLNHMDPLESVVTIFNRQLADVDSGNKEALGATLCLWPDRAVAQEEDVIKMNGVYPAMLAFAERTWVGGGYAGWVANANLKGEEAFEAFEGFENRLMDHKKLYFKKLSFPYFKQSDITWKLFGPYINKGNLAVKFEPENPGFDPEKAKPNSLAVGGTIVLRHWWAPKIEGVLTKPSENTTWYAFHKIWSDQDTVRGFWIGFNNFSRSQATDTPQEGTWDNHQSKVWLNGELVEPPQWLHGGQKGNLEVPIANEGYEYRAPTFLQLKKGWNTFKVKAPIGRFAGRNWNNPEKWMFTIVNVTP